MTSPALPVHSFAETLAAARTSAAEGRAVTVVAPAHGFGVGWLHSACAQAVEEVAGAELVPLLDCADAPGLALAALRRGYPLVRLDLDGRAWAAVAEIADQCGAKLLRDLPGP